MKNLMRKVDPKRTFVTSDLHFNHGIEPILKARGVKNIEENNQWIIDRWTDAVPSDADVFNLGDMFLGGKAYDEVINLINQLSFRRMYILWGNHNSGVSEIYRKAKLNLMKGQRKFESLEVYPVKHCVGNNKLLIFLGDKVSIQTGTKDHERFVMQHFPEKIWHRNNRGSVMLHGHSHGNDRETNFHTAKLRRFDVGIDVIPPTSLEAISARAAELPNSPYHHDEEEPS